MHRLSPLVISLFFILAASFVLADNGSRQAYVIELQNQTPENLIRTIKPLLDEGDGISSYDNELIITTDAQRIANIRQIIATLDEAQQNLLISVKNNNAGSTTENGSGFSGGIKQETIRIDTGEPIKQQKGVTVSSNGLAFSTHTTKHSYSTRAEQQIRAVEGSPAFIYTGQSMNLPNHDSQGNVYNSEVSADKGFYVTAHINGDRVQLEISASNDSFAQNSSSRNPTINTQHLSTTVSGRVGEWIALGGISLGESDDTNSTVKKITTSAGSLGDISVKITPVN